MKILVKFLKWIGLIFVLPLLGFWGLVAWDTWRLETAVAKIAASFAVGGSPWVVPLPEDRVVMMSVSKQDSMQICADLAIRRGVVRSARIAGQSVPLAFDQGIDLTLHAAALQSCDRANIVLMANWSFLKSGFVLEYAESRVTRITAPRRWD